MKRLMKRFLGSILVLSLVVLSLSSMSSFASTDVSTTTDKTYTVEEMLNYAIQDEYMALAEYQAVINKFNVTRPFTNIVKSEQIHIDLLKPLLTTYKVEMPTTDWASKVTLPATIEEVYKNAINEENKNIEMYAAFLKQDLPDDVKAVIERLKTSSEKHLKAFERQGECLGTGLGYGKQNGNGKGLGRGNGQGMGRGNGLCNQSGECLRP